MLDQLFTAENFRRVFDAENRKGADLASRFFPALDPLTSAAKDKRLELRKLRKQEGALAPDTFMAQVAELKKEIAALKAEKSAALDEELEAISERVLLNSFNIDLTKRPGPKGKDVYCIDERPETYFVVKQLQRNLHKLYGIKQSNRHDLVCRVRDTLFSRFPYEVVRTDISNFYESIDRKNLVGKLERDQLLSPSSRKYIKQILDSYGKRSGNQNGVPRGVGISAYLAELYLRPLDHRIGKIPGLVLYCRYVDDIIAIFARPPTGEAPASYEEQIAKELSAFLLTPNPDKSKAFRLGQPKSVKFEYLGYRFHIDEDGGISLSLSAAKMRKYKMRVNVAFDSYWKDRSVRSRRSYRDLVARVKFLAGNTRLANSKSGAVTGIFYNNALMDRTASLELLDTLLKRRIEQLNVGRLKKRLKKYKFTKGFEQRRFHNFSTRELANIVRVWKSA